MIKDVLIDAASQMDFKFSVI